MAREIGEDLLFDLINKRRAGEFTGDEILWAAEHPWVIRWAREHFDIVNGLRTGQLGTVKHESLPCVRLARELIPQGWKVAVIDGVFQDVEPSVSDLSKLKLDEVVGGKLGLADGKRFLIYQRQLPAEFFDWSITLGGTILCDENGDLHFPCLLPNEGHWYLDFDSVRM